MPQGCLQSKDAFAPGRLGLLVLQSTPQTQHLRAYQILLLRDQGTSTRLAPIPGKNRSSGGCWCCWFMSVTEACKLLTHVSRLSSETPKQYLCQLPYR